MTDGMMVVEGGSRHIVQSSVPSLLREHLKPYPKETPGEQAYNPTRPSDAFLALGVTAGFSPCSF
jgi:hypothetical protein